MRTVFLFIIQSASNSLALFLQKETWRLTVPRKARHKRLDCEVQIITYNIIDKTVLSHDFKNKKNHGLYDKADKDYSLRVFCVQKLNYDLLCSDYTCAMIPNNQILSQASKRRATSKSVDGFPRSGSCAIWMANPLKSRVRVRVRVGRVRAVYKRTL